ncbi:PREDICTED: uncharacterized protein LOC107120163 [Gekko japonicus]|uniref:Uncharacterized protein LOC107120163 n=1 Tax=Gekko japonicus TaxID=146911 RepID=A0ABM1KX59_GEKJA|nr:PREDICTED: uncharacterized protein LOC107120163 [Gekko japonicus]
MDETDRFYFLNPEPDEQPKIPYWALDERRLAGPRRGTAPGPGSRDPMAEVQRDAGEGLGRDEGGSEDSTTPPAVRMNPPRRYAVVPSGSSPLEEEEEEEATRKQVKGETEGPGVDSPGHPVRSRKLSWPGPGTVLDGETPKGEGLVAEDLLPAVWCPGATREYKYGDPPGLYLVGGISTLMVSRWVRPAPRWFGSYRDQLTLENPKQNAGEESDHGGDSADSATPSAVRMKSPRPDPVASSGSFSQEEEGQLPEPARKRLKGETEKP